LGLSDLDWEIVATANGANFPRNFIFVVEPVCGLKFPTLIELN